MSLTKLCRAFAVPLIGYVLAGCSPPDNPYARIANPPLVRAKLHTVTVVTPDAALPVRLTEEAGYDHKAFMDPNYPATAPAESAYLMLPEEVTTNSVFFFPFMGHGPNVRIAFMMDVKPVEPAHEDVDAAFYRNVLGADPPQWQGSKQLRNGARVQAYTFQVDDLLAARKRLQEGGIPITVEPGGITTAYLGTHQAMAIRAPDGTPVQLIQGMAQ